MNGSNKDQGSMRRAIGGLSGWALFAAFVVLVAFGAMVWHLITQVGAVETTWTRLAWLFSSVEAIAFGAAGALFGSNIQRQRAENAEADARKNADAAAKGHALAATMKADAAVTGSGPSNQETFGPGSQSRDPAANMAARHAAIAQELFP